MQTTSSQTSQIRHNPTIESLENAESYCKISINTINMVDKKDVLNLKVKIYNKLMDQLLNNHLR